MTYRLLACDLRLGMFNADTPSHFRTFWNLLKIGSTLEALEMLKPYRAKLVIDEDRKMYIEFEREEEAVIFLLKCT